MENRENRKKTTVYLKPSMIARIDSLLALDNCESRSELVENALRFYIGYLTTTDVTQYLSQALVAVLKGVVDDNENRLRTLIFKLCVELNMMSHTLATHFGDEEIDWRERRGYAVDEVKRTCGHIDYERTVKEYRMLDGEEWLE